MRELAAALRVSPATVAAAYRTLKHRGFVVADRGRGTTVAARPPVADLWMVDLNGESKVNLTAGKFCNLMPAWSAGNKLYFVSDRAGTENIWALDTGGALQLARGGNNSPTTVTNAHGTETHSVSHKTPAPTPFFSSNSTSNSTSHDTSHATETADAPCSTRSVASSVGWWSGSGTPRRRRRRRSTSGASSRPPATGSWPWTRTA